MSFWTGFAVGVSCMFMAMDIGTEYLFGKVTGDWKRLEKSLMFDSLILAAMIFLFWGGF